MVRADAGPSAGAERAGEEVGGWITGYAQILDLQTGPGHPAERDGEGRLGAGLQSELYVFDNSCSPVQLAHSARLATEASMMSVLP